MAQDVEVAIVGPEFEELMFRAEPLIQGFFDRLKLRFSLRERL
jgi:hypothetical protein